MSGQVIESHHSPLLDPVTMLTGVGPERGRLLEKLEIRTVEDLLLHRPRRYEDRQKLLKISQLQLREPAITHGRIVAQGTKWFRHHSKSIFEIILEDDTGRLHCRWWNLPYMEKYFTPGDEVLVFGKPLQLKPKTIDHPETEILERGEENSIHLNRLTPIYPLTEGLGQRWLRALIWKTLALVEASIQDPPWSATAAAGPGEFRRLTRARALRLIHFPEKQEQTEQARQRLALEEFVSLQCQIQGRRKHFIEKAIALPCGGNNRFIKPFLKQLAFKLTRAQTAVLREIRNDMSGRHPMRRLLQGDVGSGKTIVAGCAALMAIECGFEVALMAPTEILAEQHFATFAQWFAPLGIRVELCTGTRKPDVNNSKQHPTAMIVGTHALIESGFAPENLGLVIIDEQHKFGVTQREKLLRKGRFPHLLVMTATPIPRTLGLTLYGDLNTSVLDELPPGRRPIKTFVRSAAQLPKVWDFVRAQLASGRQAYVVYPHIEENAATDIKAVKAELANLKPILSPFRIGVLHGRLGPEDRSRAMAEFRKGDAQVLLTTSVIEVGVDVSNANVMVIENAEQFGLAQLHQLRGRIGRGPHDSFCILVGQTKGQAAQQRLKVLEQTQDGFELAEADLKMRGPGELVGQAQSGIPRFRFGDFTTDFELIKEAREIARGLLG